MSDVDIRGLHPRPQSIRPNQWWSLDGPWQFTFDDDDAGQRERWYQSQAAGKFSNSIIVPFPPESPASGINDQGDHAALWYRRTLALPATLTELGTDRLVLHFDAVDYEADVWVDGQHGVHHEGGQTPFSLDITDLLAGNIADDQHTIVVRAVDDRTDIEQPRGKQDWRLEQHVIWYNRTSGIWRTVWLERVPRVHLTDLRWITDKVEAGVRLQARLSGHAPDGATLRVRIHQGDQVLGIAEVMAVGSLVDLIIPIPLLTNGLEGEGLGWTPDAPNLLDAEVELLDSDRQVIDRLESYLGLRSIAVKGGDLTLNGRPFYLRAVLEQGYWPESHLTPPSLEALRAEVELTKAMGFNTVRVHQKVEDPRYLYWCDKLGLAVWSETAAASKFTDEAVSLLTREWLDIVRRDVSHPCIIAWVPFNESWGIGGMSTDASRAAFSRSLTDLTRALDGSRPVMSNDGWEHTNSDLLTIHDYAATGAELEARYRDASAARLALAGAGPAGWQMWVGGPVPEPDSIPLILSEFGGVGYDPKAEPGTWGYSTATSASDLEARLTDLMQGVFACHALRGYCYTQLTDTGLETNGLTYANREPKLPLETLHRIFTGRK